MLARPLWKKKKNRANSWQTCLGSGKHLKKRVGRKVAVNFLRLVPLSPLLFSTEAICFDPLPFWVALLKQLVQGGPPASSLYRNLGEAKRERKKKKKINGASLDVSSRRCKHKTKRILQDPRRLTSRFQREPERCDDGYIWESVTWFSYKQDNSCKQESKSEERLSPLWFGLYYLRSVQVELRLLQQ